MPVELLAWLVPLPPVLAFFIILLLTKHLDSSVEAVSVTATDIAAGNTSAFAFLDLLSGTDEVAEIPTVYALQQNYPNPFNPTAGIRYHLPASGQAGVPGVSDVKLVVYDLLGREVEVLVDERKAAGRHEVHFDASRLASGVYVYRLMAGQYVESRKMILMK